MDSAGSGVFGGWDSTGGGSSETEANEFAVMPISYVANSLNRRMGQPDLYGFVLAPTVIGKLRFPCPASSAGVVSVSGIRDRAAILRDGRKAASSE